MAELKVYLPDELDQRFRRMAMNTYGYGRGSLSKAAVEALSKWCSDHEPVQPQTPAETTAKEERVENIGEENVPELFEHGKESRLAG